MKKIKAIMFLGLVVALLVMPVITPHGRVIIGTS
jgi:hypothetical protein